MSADKYLSIFSRQMAAIKTYRLSWHLTRVSANHASSNWALAARHFIYLCTTTFHSYLLVLEDYWLVGGGGGGEGREIKRTSHRSPKFNYSAMLVK